MYRVSPMFSVQCTAVCTAVCTERGGAVGSGDNCEHCEHQPGVTSHNWTNINTEVQAGHQAGTDVQEGLSKSLCEGTHGKHRVWLVASCAVLWRESPGPYSQEQLPQSNTPTLCSARENDTDIEQPQGTQQNRDLPSLVSYNLSCSQRPQ